MSSDSMASMDHINRDLVEENNLQSRIIDAMGQFTANLPDYSKNDVIMFIARQINSPQLSYIDLASQNQQVNELFFFVVGICSYLKAIAS